MKLLRLLTCKDGRTLLDVALGQPVFLEDGRMVLRPLHPVKVPPGATWAELRDDGAVTAEGPTSSETRAVADPSLEQVSHALVERFNRA